MEILALGLLKTLASTCLKFYLGYLFSAGGIDVERDALNYKIPSWYMNPGKHATAFYAYGTSVEGDEFESIEDARQQAINQMVDLLNRSHQRIITEEINYDKESLKQRRLVALFLRGENLHTFILNHAVLDKKKLVKVDETPPDLRAFVRLKLSTADYLEHQDSTLRELRKKLTYQKSDDIMAEMAAEMKKMQSELPPHAGRPSGPTPHGTNAPPQPNLTPPNGEPTPPAPAGSVFDAMENELENLK